jgi:hypothetical protein
MSDEQQPAAEQPVQDDATTRALDMAGAGQVILPAKLDGHKGRPRPAAIKRPRPAPGKRK